MNAKRITAANSNAASGRSREETQRYWAETHGPFVANSPTLRRYHHFFSLPEAYDSEPKPTFIGISMFWRDNPMYSVEQETDPFSLFYRNQPGGSDDRQLFDREPRWPLHDQHVDITGEEHVLIDGAVEPTMVNAIFMVCRRPGLDHRSFFEHWSSVHAQLAMAVPGLRRYIQNHAYLEAFARGTMTHDGWSEFWFDDFESFQRAVASAEWRAMQADGETLFSPEVGIVIGHQYVQKDENWKPRDYGALSMSEEEIRDRLNREGYFSIARDPDAPRRIKAAAQAGRLAVWTAEHLATFDESPIDARPERV